RDHALSPERDTGLLKSGGRAGIAIMRLTLDMAEGPAPALDTRPLEGAPHARPAIPRIHGARDRHLHQADDGLKAGIPTGTSKGATPSYWRPKSGSRTIPAANAISISQNVQRQRRRVPWPTPQWPPRMLFWPTAGPLGRSAVAPRRTGSAAR